METAEKSNATKCPITKYWNMVKTLDNAQRLELGIMLIESVKPALAETAVDTYEQSLKQYTADELYSMLERARADFAAGLGIPDEDAWNEEELALIHEDDYKMAV